MKTLKIQVGNVSRPVILDSDNYTGTVMEDPINSAKKIFDRILRNASSYLEVENRKKRDRIIKEF